jgi:hypothetical protein
VSFLTDGDRINLPLGMRQNRGFHVSCKWYLRGWSPLPYQYLYHHLTQMDTTFLAGIAAGKTTTAAASFVVDCITTPYFRTLNTSISARQAELPFEMIMSWIEDNPNLEHLVENITLRPFPQIDWRNRSYMAFRTMGKDARLIRGEEYDRINVDEGGLQATDEALKVLRGRLRGERPTGEKRMGRMDVITSPTGVQWLKTRFHKGYPGHSKANLKHYYSIRARTRDNTHLTEAQIQAMERMYPSELIAVEMDAEFPDFGFGMFPESHVAACTDLAMNEELNAAVRTSDGKDKPGYRLEEDPRHGILKFEFPYNPHGLYIASGDPGVDNPPKRNAGVVMVADLSEGDIKIVYMHWVTGNGKYDPWIQSLKYAIQKYYPILRGIDATGTQKAIDELAFENFGIQTDKLLMQRDKDAMLNALSIDFSGHKLRFPQVPGLHKQLVSYSRDLDNKSLPQDLVMTLAQLSFLARFAPEDVDEDEQTQVNNYWNRHTRSVRRRR